MTSKLIHLIIIDDKLPAVATSATITYRTRVNGVSFTIAFSVSCPVNEINTTAVDYIPSTVGYRSKTEPSNYSAKPLVGQSYILVLVIGH